jgi:FtsP/CotA-like multicopper oxidase with cupredoxin domain
MTGAQLMAADLAIAAVCAAGWLGAAVTLAAGRGWLARALVAIAALATLGRVGVVMLLAGHGWWFVQEKVSFALPVVGVAAVAAAVAAFTGGASRAVVPLFMTGYASATGLVLPLVTGYPLNLNQTMIGLSAVGVATLLTWRAVAPIAASRFLTVGGVSVVALGLAGVALGFVPAEPAQTVAPGAIHVTDLRGPTQPEPGGTVRRFELAARKAEVTLSSGRQVEAWTFNGTVPGPAITAVEGDLIEVTLSNVDIKDGVTLHWHGYGVPNGEDGAPGVTQQAVPVGGQFVYRFVADQVGTYWYHTHQVSDRGVRMGLYGALIVTARTASPSGLDLTVPVHTIGGAVVIGTNDGLDSHPAPPGTPVRLRLINTDGTPHRFSLTGTGFRVVAADGNDLRGPQELTGVAMRLAAGARYDVAFDIPAGPVALLVDDSAHMRIGNGDASVNTATWPELDLTTYGTPGPTPFGPGSRFDRDFTLVLDRGLALVEGSPAYAHTVNGRAFPKIPTEWVRQGDLVRLTVVNRGWETHPWHLHGHRVLVLSKDGRPVTGSPLWLDTFDVRPGELWQVAFRADNPGVWMNHCHNLGHAEQGMALHLAYEEVTTSLHGGHGG